MNDSEREQFDFQLEYLGIINEDSAVRLIDRMLNSLGQLSGDFTARLAHARMLTSKKHDAAFIRGVFHFMHNQQFPPFTDEQKTQLAIRLHFVQAYFQRRARYVPKNHSRTEMYALIASLLTHHWHHTGGAWMLQNLGLEKSLGIPLQ